MVPNGWLLKSLNELTNEKLAYGANAAACDFHENGFRYIRITDIDDQGNLNENVVGIEESAGALHHLEDNDFLFARSGNTVGKTFLFEEAIHPKSAYAGYLIRYRPDPSKLTPHYLKQFCFSGKYENWVKSQIRAGAQPNINAKEYGSMEIPLPPIPEQQKVAKILSTWDKAISTTERLIENSTQQKKALMQQLLTGKKRLLDDEGKRFAGEWVRQPISFVADVITGNTPSTKNQEYYGGDKLFVSPSDLGVSKYILETTKRLTNLGFSQTRKVPKGSSLFTCIGSTIGKLGIAGEELATNQQINSVCAKGNNCGEFIYYQLLFHAEQIKGSAATQAVPIINKTNFESQLIFSPPLHKEQQKIATVLTNADKEIELLEQQLADLQQEKKALMQVLLTGKKRVLVDGENL